MRPPQPQKPSAETSSLKDYHLNAVAESRVPVLTTNLAGDVPALMYW
jgi:hypothetical protein